MRYITAKTSQVITLGRQGENDALQVWFPVMENLISTYGEGTVSLVVQRPRDPFPYVAVTSNDETFVYWTVKKEDVGLAGDGLCQIVYIVDGVVVKSLVYRTLVTPSIGENTKPVKPYQSWVNIVLEAARDVAAALGIIERMPLPFVAIYDETPFEEIQQAIADGRAVLAKGPAGMLLPFAAPSQGKYVFSGMAGNTRYSYMVSADSTWERTSDALARMADIEGLGGGDMLKANYDTTNTGSKVDTALNAEKLGGNLASKYVQTTRKINGKDLSADVTLAAGDVGAAPASHTHSAADVGAAPASHTHAAGDITSGQLAVARGGTGNSSVDTTPTSGSTKMVTSGGLYTAFSDKLGRTNNITGDGAVGTKMVRAIYAGTSDMTAGSTALTTGAVYLVYEA